MYYSYTVRTGSFIYNMQNVYSNWLIATYFTLAANMPVF